jgi:hypothetical protein
LFWLFLKIQSHNKLCPGWPQTTILWISAFQVARIIGVSHQHPASRMPSSIAFRRQVLQQAKKIRMKHQLIPIKYRHNFGLLNTKYFVCILSVTLGKALCHSIWNTDAVLLKDVSPAAL